MGGEGRRFWIYGINRLNLVEDKITGFFLFVVIAAKELQIRLDGCMKIF